jgi:GNAT superfamily N-acetyltransferase
MSSALALAQRLEGAEVALTLARARANLAFASASNHVAFLEIGGGVAAFFGEGSPLSGVRGLGMDGPLRDGEAESLETFFRTRGAKVAVSLCPYADASVVAALGDRGYRLAECEQVFVRPVEAARGPLPEGIEIERVPPEGADAWALTVAQGFVGAMEVPAEARAVGMALFHAPRVACFHARVGGVIAGAGAVDIANGVASFFAASTVPRFRRHGVQRALLEARLAHAAGEGCDLAMVSAAPGSGSERNVARSGFHPVYTRVTLIGG